MFVGMGNTPPVGVGVAAGDAGAAAGGLAAGAATAGAATAGAARAEVGAEGGAEDTTECVPLPMETWLVSVESTLPM